MEKVKKESGNNEVVLEVVDVSDMLSMQSFASKYNSSGQALNVIVNSAGIMVCCTSTFASYCTYGASLGITPSLDLRLLPSIRDLMPSREADPKP